MVLLAGIATVPFLWCACRFYYADELFTTASVVQWSDFLAADSEVPDSIPGVTTFSE
jgi:hypothetical protein